MHWNEMNYIKRWLRSQSLLGRFYFTKRCHFYEDFQEMLLYTWVKENTWAKSIWVILNCVYEMPKYLNKEIKTLVGYLADIWHHETGYL